MAHINPRTNVVPQRYARIGPGDPEGDFEALRVVLDDLAYLIPQVADEAPTRPRKGLIRYAVSPWNPLGTGDGWVYYDGTSWVALA